MFKLRYHILFWLFIAAYNFDYLIDVYSWKTSTFLTLFELAIYISEFYINLNLFLPSLFAKGKRSLYLLSVFLLLAFFCSLYFISGLNYLLLSEDNLRAITSFFLNHTLFVIISYFVWYFNRYHFEKQRSLQLENERLFAELNSLKSKISPHFLFNGLNDIYTLIITKKESAAEMTAALSDLLRYLLYDCSKPLVPLSAEIQAIQNYLEMQKLREIEGRNNIQFEIPGDAESICLPPLLLIPLVENCFKHGNITTDETGFAKIQIYREGKKISAHITNSFSPRQHKEGIGLKNLQSQLQLLYGENYTFESSHSTDVFTIKLIIHGENC